MVGLARGFDMLLRSWASLIGIHLRLLTNTQIHNVKGTIMLLESTLGHLLSALLGNFLAYTGRQISFGFLREE